MENRDARPKGPSVALVRVGKGRGVGWGGSTYSPFSGIRLSKGSMLCCPPHLTPYPSQPPVGPLRHEAAPTGQLLNCI